MSGSRALPGLILAKVREQVERAEHLLALIPAGKEEWRPEMTGARIDPPRLDQLLGHLLECLAGFCAVLYAWDSQRLAYFVRLRERKVNEPCGVEEAHRRMREYLKHIVEGFALLTDEDLARPVPTVFVPQGEALLTLLLGNLEHLINHKHQLFVYVKMMGVPVTTKDLYHWRGKS